MGPGGLVRLVAPTGAVFVRLFCGEGGPNVFGLCFCFCCFDCFFFFLGGVILFLRVSLFFKGFSFKRGFIEFIFWGGAGLPCTGLYLVLS